MLTHSFKVYPNQCDVNGHLNTQFFVQAFEAAAWELVAALGDRVAGVQQAAATGWADVRTTIEYHSELLAGARVQIDSRISRFGTTSMQVRHEMRRADDGQLVATMDSVSVRIDLRARRPMPIPVELIAAAKAQGLVAPGDQSATAGSGKQA